jgi:hypothetical protein
MAIVKSVEALSGLNGPITALVELEMTDAFVYDPSGDREVRLISAGASRIPDVLAIYANPPYTTVKWGDGSTTTVKCCEDDTYSEAQGFAAALTKKLYGGRNESSSHVKKFVAEHVVRQQKKGKKKNSNNVENAESANATA